MNIKDPLTQKPINRAEIIQRSLSGLMVRVLVYPCRGFLLALGAIAAAKLFGVI